VSWVTVLGFGTAAVCGLGLLLYWFCDWVEARDYRREMEQAQCPEPPVLGGASRERRPSGHRRS
jgi:hypothetical protein